MVGVDSGSLYRLSRLAWSWVGGRLAPFYIHQMKRMNSRKWLCHDDSTINIVLDIISFKPSGHRGLHGTLDKGRSSCHLETYVFMYLTHTYQSCSPSYCRRLQHSFTADMMCLTSVCITIIIVTYFYIIVNL